MTSPGATNPRLLRHVRQSLKPLGQNGDHRFAAEMALVHYPSRSVFSFIPKNACSTLRVSLAMAHGCIADPVTDWSWIHANNQTFRASLADLVTAPFTFVILRCPHARLASAFLDKIVSRNVEFWTLHRAERESFSPTDLTFRQFVQLIAKPGNLRLDLHWRPQVDFLVYEEYDAWYAMERLDSALEEISARTGMQMIDARPLTRHGTAGQAQVGLAADLPVAELERMKAEGRLPRQADLYDAALRAQVAQLYRADLALYTARLGAGGLTFAQG